MSESDTSREESLPSSASPAPDASEGRHEPPPSKEPLAPNEGKSLTIVVGGSDDGAQDQRSGGHAEGGSGTDVGSPDGDGTWARIPIQTELFSRGDPLAEKVTGYVVKTVELAVDDDRFRPGFDERWYVVVSEKIVAISQGRSYFTWEINPGAPARVLSKFVQRTPYGIGLGSPWTMQLAINEAGLPRILLAAGASIVGKALGRKGWFYRVAGHRVNAIDGPTPYSAYPSNVSAKLPPKDPDRVAATLSAALREALPTEVAGTFGGTVVIDSNDLGRDVLGHDTDRAAGFFCSMFRDNPFGQGRQQTPIAVCVRASAEA